MHVGDRIAVHRRRRGMSQEALAGLIGKSLSWMSQVERGIRGVDRLSTFADLAAALRVDISDLIGREWRLEPTATEQVRAIDAIRSQLAGYSHLLNQDDARGLWPLPQMRNASVRVHQAYQAANYGAAAAMAPELLQAADALNGYNGHQSVELHLARCNAYAVAAKLLTKVGEANLAWLAADRATHAAIASGSVVAQGVAAREVATALLRSQRNEDAERIAVHTAERLMTNARSDAPDSVSLAGSMWLLAAVISARNSDRVTAMTRLQQADELAGLLAHDANHAWTAFGPTNVRIHRASVAAELGDHHGVLRAATEIDPEALPQGLNGRRSRLHLDLAWAQTQAKHDMEAILHLQQAERAAPESIKYHTIIREMIRELLKRSKKPNAALSGLAKRAGVLSE